MTRIQDSFDPILSLASLQVLYASETNILLNCNTEEYAARGPSAFRSAIKEVSNWNYAKVAKKFFSPSKPLEIWIKIQFESKDSKHQMSTSEFLMQNPLKGIAFF